MTFNKYAKWGDYHWKEFARPSIYRQHALHVSKWITEPQGLDVGCGDGLITSLLGPGWSGIDPDATAIRLARDHGVRASEGDVYKLAGWFDAVYLGDVIEHLEAPEKALESIATITNVLYLATPPRNGKQLREHHCREWTESELVGFMAAHDWSLDGDIVTANDRMYGRFARWYGRFTR